MSQSVGNVPPDGLKVRNNIWVIPMLGLSEPFQIEYEGYVHPVNRTPMQHLTTPSGFHLVALSNYVGYFVGYNFHQISRLDANLAERSQLPTQNYGQ